MTADWKEFLIELTKQSVVNPRAAARTILNLPFPNDVLWIMVLLVVILSVLLTYVTMMAAGPVVGLFGFAKSPLLLTVFMAANMVFLIFGLYWAGRAIGGQGDLKGFIALVTWLQALLLLAQVIQTVLIAFSPLLSSMFGTVSLLYCLWILILFISEAHGFDTWLKGLAVLLIAVLGVSAGLSILLSLIGVSTLGLSNYV